MPRRLDAYRRWPMPRRHAANRLGLDYHAEALRLGPPPVPIIDVHTHINGPSAAAVYREVAALYGVEQCYSMTRLEDVPRIRDHFGESIHFIAVPNYFAEDRRTAYTTDWLDRIEKFAALGSKICKFWTAPRARDIGREIGEPDIFDYDSPWRRRAMSLARDFGMIFMTHVADPDTWFATKYADASFYGTKRDQYVGFERSLDEFADTPWIAAHLGGWPEDLEFLDGLLSRHANLYLDTSATKWMVRELSRHPRATLLAFMERWRGRILFGSDIVTSDEHLRPGESHPGAGLASSTEEAFDLYASRYWALRTLWETDYEGESPIADPDLAMVAPEQFGPYDAPTMRGLALPQQALAALYREAAVALCQPEPPRR